MEERRQLRRVQNLNIPQGSSEPYSAFESTPFGVRIDTPRIGHLDSQLPNLSYYRPLWNQV